MTDKNDPEADDIDAFLRDDASTNIRKPGDDDMVVPRGGSIPPTTDPVARFNSRITHVSRSLNMSLDHANEMSKTMSTDQSMSDDFSKDIDEWEAVIEALERALPALPDAEKSDGQNNELHEDVSAAIASHIDTYVEAERAKEDASGLSGRLPLNQQVADAFEELAEPFEELAEQWGNGVEKTAGHADQEEPTINREQQELLRSLENRESRIRELELRLAAIEDSQAPDADAEPASVMAESEDGALHVNRLIVAINGIENLKYPLSRHIMTIGREPHNDIHVRSRYVSRFHARIVSDRDGAIIEDLDSRNGVLVNSRKVRRAQLKSGDLIDLGRVQLKYIDLMEGSAGEGQA